MNVSNFLDKLKDGSQKEILIASLVRYLSSLPDTLADAAYQAAILRWFNAKVLGGVMKKDDEGQTATSTSSPEALYEQLQKLPFTEEFPGRGHSFHELTRKMILSYLWEQKPDFYRQVSNQAKTFFGEIMDTQSNQLDKGEIEPAQVDAGIVVEFVYHYIIVDEKNAVAEIDGFLADMIISNRMGVYHDTLEAVVEHAKAGRLSSDWNPLVNYWQLKEAYVNFDFDQLEKKTQELLQLPDTDTSLNLKADAVWFLADGFRLNNQYDEARRYYEESFRRSEEIEYEEGKLQSMLGLGNLESALEQYSRAVEYYMSALLYKTQQLRDPVYEESEHGYDTPLKVFYPNAWHRREVTTINREKEDADKTLSKGDDQVLDSKDGKAATQEPFIKYFIELDIDQNNLVELESEKDDKSLPEWPIEVDATLAELWYKLGLQQEGLGFIGRAAACGQLAVDMYLDLGDLASAQSALQMLERLAKAVIDPEYIKQVQYLRDQIISEADARGDQVAKLSGLIDQAKSYYDREQYNLARERYEEAYTQAEKMEDDNDKAVCLEGLAQLRWVDGDYHEAERNFKLALELYQKVRNKYGQATILVSLGDLHLQHHRFTEAIDNFNAVLETYRALGSISGQYDTLGRLSDVAQAQGDYEKAFIYLGQVLELSRKDEGLSLETAALTKIGKLYLSLGDDPKANEAFDKALDIAMRIGQQSIITNILLDEADILEGLAEYGRVVNLSDKIIEIDPSLGITYRRKGWALLHLDKHYALDAKRALEEAIQRVPDEWWAHKEIANALWVVGDYESARKKYQWVIDQIEHRVVKSYLPTLGWCHYKLGNYEKSKEIYNEIVNSDPDPVSDYFDLGLIHLCLGNYAEALHEYKRGFTYLEHKNPVRMRLGFLHVAMFDLQEAIETNPKLTDVKECIEIQQLLRDTWASVSEWKAPDIKIELDNADRCNYRALIYNNLGNAQAAIAEFGRAIALDPDQANFYANRAQSYLTLESPEPGNALADMTKAIELDPQNPDRYYDRVQFHIKQENYKEALVDINQAIGLRPEDVELIATRADIYRYLDSDETVQGDLARIIELMPNNPEGYLMRATYFIELENYQAAIRDYSNIIELQPENADYYNSRANLFANSGDWQAALSDYNQAIKLKPEISIFYTNRAQAYAVLGKPEEARADLNKAIEIEPRNADYYNSRANLFANSEDWQAALSDYNQAIKLKPEISIFYTNRAQAYAVLGKPEEARADLNKAIEIEPRNADYYNIRAQFQIQQVNYQDALADINQALKLRPEDVASLAWRAKIEAESGNFQAALGDYTQAIKLYKGEDPDLYIARALVFSNLEKFPEALIDINRSIELQPEIGYYYHFRALAYIDIGNFEASLSDLDTADKLEKDNQESISFNLIWRGLIYQLTNEQKEAYQVWKQAKLLAEELQDPVSQHRLLALSSMYFGDTRASREHYRILFKINPTPYHIYMQHNYLIRSRRLLPERIDIIKLVKWFEKKLPTNLYPFSST